MGIISSDDTSIKFNRFMVLFNLLKFILHRLKRGFQDKYLQIIKTALLYCLKYNQESLSASANLSILDLKSKIYLLHILKR